MLDCIASGDDPCSVSNPTYIRVIYPVMRPKHLLEVRLYKCNPKQELPGGQLGGRFSLMKNGGTSMKVLSIEEHGETEPIVCLFQIEL